MSLLCAYQFELRPGDGQTSRGCFDAVRDEVAGWLCELYHAFGMDGVAVPFDGSCLSPRPGHELWSDQRECATHRLATLEWSWPADNDPTLSWLFAAAVACDDTAVQVSLLVWSVASRPFVLRPAIYHLAGDNPLMQLPALAAALLRRWPGAVGGWPVPTQARLLRANALDGFVRQTLFDPARTLPVVLLNLTGPLSLSNEGVQGPQRVLLGLAQVAALANETAVRRLTELLGAERSCAGSLGRVYFPGFTRDGPPAEHTLFRLEELIQFTQGQSLDAVLLIRLLQLFAARYRDGALLRAARLAIERDRDAWRQTAGAAERDLAAARGAARLARGERDRLRQECATARQVIRSLQGDLAAARDASAAPARPATFDELAAELEKAWDENRRLTAEVEAGRQQAAELRAELRVHQENWALLRAARPAGAPAPGPAAGHERAFATVGDALAAAADEFGDVLAVWEDAARAAAASPFAMPAKVFRALEAIAEVGRAYFAARDGGPPLGPVEHAFACRVPFKYTGFESQTTLSLYGAERVFHDGDRGRQMQRHLTLGGGTTNNCLQIYFDFDDDSRRVLVGYCGRHLPYHRQRT